MAINSGLNLDQHIGDEPLEPASALSTSLDSGTHGFSLVDRLFDAYTQRCWGGRCLRQDCLQFRWRWKINGEDCKNVGEPRIERHALKDGWKCKYFP